MKKILSKMLIIGVAVFVGITLAREWEEFS